MKTRVLMATVGAAAAALAAGVMWTAPSASADDGLVSIRERKRL